MLHTGAKCVHAACVHAAYRSKVCETLPTQLPNLNSAVTAEMHAPLHADSGYWKAVLASLKHNCRNGFGETDSFLKSCSTYSFNLHVKVLAPLRVPIRFCHLFVIIFIFGNFIYRIIFGKVCSCLVVKTNHLI